MKRKGKGIVLYILLIVFFSIVVLIYTYQYNRVLGLIYDIEGLKREMADLQIENERLKKDIEGKIEEYYKNSLPDDGELIYPRENQVIWIRETHEE